MRWRASTATNKWSKASSLNWSPAPVWLDHADWPVDGAGLRVGHHLLHGFTVDKLEMEMWWEPGTGSHQEQNMKFRFRIQLPHLLDFINKVCPTSRLTQYVEKGFNQTCFHCRKSKKEVQVRVNIFPESVWLFDLDNRLWFCCCAAFLLGPSVGKQTLNNLGHKSDSISKYLPRPVCTRLPDKSRMIQCLHSWIRAS